MKRRIWIAALFAVAGLLVSGCANPPIVPLGSDTYILSREDHAGIFGSMAKLKAGVISDANTFAASKGKVAVPVSVREKPVGNSPGDWATFEYQFRLLDPDSPEAKRGSLNADRQVLPVRPNASVQSSQSISADVSVAHDQPQSEAPKDIYSELIKLEDLRKRGILTQEEFEVQKAKLLGGR